MEHFGSTVSKFQPSKGRRSIFLSPKPKPAQVHIFGIQIQKRRRSIFLEFNSKNGAGLYLIPLVPVVEYLFSKYQTCTAFFVWHIQRLAGTSMVRAQNEVWPPLSICPKLCFHFSCCRLLPDPIDSPLKVNSPLHYMLDIAQCSFSLFNCFFK